MAKRGVVIEISHRPLSFALTFLALFAITFIFLSAVGATPNPLEPSDNTPSTEVVDTTNPEAPVRVVATDVSLDQTVVNPSSTDITVLDESLKDGAVRYPTSAQLGEKGTVLLFGHSTSLPIVRNQYYKTFNGIQNLKPGQIISVYSGTTEYRYAVTGVRVANANDDIVELPNDDKYLTLVTCNSFAAKTSRFVVTAKYVRAYAAI